MNSPPPVIIFDKGQYVIFKIINVKPFDDGQYTLTLNQGDINFKCIVFGSPNDGINKGVCLLRNPVADSYSIMLLSQGNNASVVAGNVYYGFPVVRQPHRVGGRRPFTSKRSTVAKSRRVRSRKMRK
jgi:hypothetical protein